MSGLPGERPERSRDGTGSTPHATEPRERSFLERHSTPRQAPVELPAWYRALRLVAWLTFATIVIAMLVGRGAPL